MKHTTIAIGITLLVTAFTSPPCSGADHEAARVASAVHWINLDGSKGAAVMSAVSYGTLAWINPVALKGSWSGT
ncbi:MAG TPA: hypothetical protein VLA67_00110 [Nitrospiraceae bacterium]|nr:hypothetical protein [Nitrospiraceae bacterium]